MQLQEMKVAAIDVAIPDVAGGMAAMQDEHPAVQRGIQRCRKASSNAEWKQEAQKGIQRAERYPGFWGHPCREATCRKVSSGAEWHPAEQWPIPTSNHWSEWV